MTTNDPSTAAEKAKKPYPSYLQLIENGELANRIQQAYDMLENCGLCPHQCGVNRLSGELGHCRAPAQPEVANHQAHFGEEKPLVGENGSGTIFFAYCTLRCVFCQNASIAHDGRGPDEPPETLANRMLELQERGCHNINLVTPSHMIAPILKAVQIAAENGLQVPLVYNTSGYDRRETIELLDGVVDIYMPDFKFMDSSQARRYTGDAEDYPERAKEAISAMYEQVGPLECDDQGIAQRGLMIRHLVMPNHAAGTHDFVHWVAAALSPDVYVNIMPQYRPEYHAHEYSRIAHSTTLEEFIDAIQWAREAGLTNLDQQSLP